MLRPATFTRHYQPFPKTGKSILKRIRYESTAILRRPPPSVPREAPTPLVFAYVKGWYEKEAKAGLRTCAVTFAEQGFTTLEVELDTVRKTGTLPNSMQDVLGLYAKELQRQITLFNIFPPVLVTRGVSTLIGNTYVESYSVSGLALIGSKALVPTALQLPDVWKAHLSSKNLSSDAPTFAVPTFTYERRFPILEVEATDNEEVLVGEINSWLDEVGL